MNYTLDDLKDSKTIDFETGTKPCTKCGETKHWTEFRVYLNGRIDYDTGERRPRINSMCAPCENEKNRESYRKNSNGSVRQETGNVKLPETFGTEFLLQQYWKGTNPVDRLGVR